jgi:hypothetical protein
VSKYGASIPWSRLDKIAAILLFGADHGQPGSNRQEASILLNRSRGS